MILQAATRPRMRNESPDSRLHNGMVRQAARRLREIRSRYPVRRFAPWAGHQPEGNGHDSAFRAPALSSSAVFKFPNPLGRDELARDFATNLWWSAQRSASGPLPVRLCRAQRRGLRMEEEQVVRLTEWRVGAVTIQGGPRSGRSRDPARQRERQTNRMAWLEEVVRAKWVNRSPRPSARPPRAQHRSS